MKERFAALDAEKKRIIDKDDLKALATKMANYRRLGSNGAGDARKRYFDTLHAVYNVQGPTTESEFINIMKASFFKQARCRDACTRHSRHGV